MSWKNCHYSVRQCNDNYPKWKIVKAGGFWGYEDLDLPFFDKFEDALNACERLEAIRKIGKV